MTVADKLVYLSETKDLLADTINSYTQVITPDTPFREYAQWIDNIVFSAEGGIPSLFDGEAGFAWSDLPYYQDPAGTTVATWGDPVGLISDDSGNGADFTQATVTARPVLRNDPPRLEFDLVDDLLQTTLPSITNGTLVLAGTNGIWIDDDFNHAGGAFTVGPTTYTGGPVGILPVVGDLIVGGSFAIDRQLTAEERTRVINKLKSMGAPGVFELGEEYANTEQSYDKNTDVNLAIPMVGTIVPQTVYFVDLQIENKNAGTFPSVWLRTTSGTPPTLPTQSGDFHWSAFITAANGGSNILGVGGPSARLTIARVSVRKLELVP